MNYPLTQMEEHPSAKRETLGLNPGRTINQGLQKKKSKIMLDMSNVMSQFRWYWNLAVILTRRLCLSSRVNSKGRRQTALFLFEKIMHQSIPPAPSPLPRATAGHLPALSVPGVGHLQILHCPARICQPRGHSQAFYTNAVSYQDITTQKVLLEKKKSRLAHLSRIGINCRGL